MKGYLTHTTINDHLVELNYGAGAKDTDTYKMEEDTLPRKNKSKESKKRKKDRMNKEKEISHSPDLESFPSRLKEGQFSETGKAVNKDSTTATK